MPATRDTSVPPRAEPTPAAANDATVRPWGRLLGVEDAARYLGISEGSLRNHVTVKPVNIGKRVLYDRLDLDRFADTLAGRGGGGRRARACEW